MQPTQWRQIVARLAANYPGQALPAETAAEWFDPLAQFPATEVWEAVDRHRRDLTEGRDGRPRGAWMPNLAELLACIDANWREAARARRELEARESRTRFNALGGVPAPPETKEAIALLKASKQLPGTPGHMTPKLVRERSDALWEQLNERQERERMGTLG